MNVSVVVPAKNEERFLPDLLDSLMPQLGYGDEVIVVDNHSTDETPNIAELYGCRVLYADDMWRGLNRAVAEEARNPVVFKTDADCVVSDYFLNEVRLHFMEDEDLVGVTGPIRDRDNVLFGNAMAAIANKLWRGLGPNQSFKRDAFLRVGGYGTYPTPLSTVTAKDVNFWHSLSRAGKTLYDPELAVSTHMSTWKARTVPLLGISGATVASSLILRKVDPSRRIVWDAVAGFGGGLAVSELGTKICGDKPLVVGELHVHHSALGLAILLLSAFVAGIPIQNQRVRDEVASAMAGLGLGMATHDWVTE